MAVLRSGAKKSKSPKRPSSSSPPPPHPSATVQQPSTPAKAREDSRSPAMGDSNLSSPSEQQQTPQLGLGLSCPVGTSAPRRSARIASRLTGSAAAAADDRRGSRRMVAGSRGGSGAVGGRRGMRGMRGAADICGGARSGDGAVVDAVGEDGNGLDLNAGGEGNSESESGCMSGGNERGCIGKRKLPEGVLESNVKRSSDLVEDRVQKSLDLGGMGSGEEFSAVSGALDEKGSREMELVLDGNPLVKDKESKKNEEGIDEWSSCSGLKYSRRKSRRIMEKFEGGLRSDLMLDLNSVPEDVCEKIPASKEADMGYSEDQVTKNGELELSLGLRSLRRSARLGNSAGGDLGSNFNLDLDLNFPAKDGNQSTDIVGSMIGGKRKYSKEEKQPVVQDNTLTVGSHVVRLDFEMDPADGGSLTEGKRRCTKEDKGKSKLLEEGDPASDHHPTTLYPDEDDAVVKGLHLLKECLQEKEHAREEWEQKGKVVEEIDFFERKNARNKARYLNTAKELAYKFAYFKPEDERDSSTSHSEEAEVPVVENGPEFDVWPGPYTTAMKIWEERAARLSARQGNSISAKSKATPAILWVPSQDRVCKRVAPSLLDLCFNILCENADAITSLEGIPDSIKSKLGWKLCDSGKMNCHILGLLASGSPSEIRLKDCSSITEDQLIDILRACKMDHLRVLQFDLCGRCLPNYIFRETVVRSPSILPSLTNISLRGAYRLSDDALSALVSSAPVLQSMNLGQCSFTSTGIINLAEKLDLRELYIDECLSVDAMLILPALEKLKHLTALSVAGVPNVCDKFVCQLLSVRGLNIKELVLADCGKLTDKSLKAIAKSCPELHTIDLSGLLKLTDSAIRYLASGCRSLTTLKLRQNLFSDEGLAAFLRSSGESLRELSVNSIKKVSDNTAIAISAHCCNHLHSLDLSFCRKLTDDAVGMIVDKCLALRCLKLFGCTKITKKFLDGHSNPLVKIVGLKETPILTNLGSPDSLQVPLRYSSEG